LKFEASGVGEGTGGGNELFSSVFIDSFCKIGELIMLSLLDIHTSNEAGFSCGDETCTSEKIDPSVFVEEINKIKNVKRNPAANTPIEPETELDHIR